VPASVNPVSEVIELAKGGKLRILAVTGSKRSPFLPDVPTMREQGYNVVVDSFTGVWLPAKTPETIVNALSSAMRAASQTKEMSDGLAKFGSEPAFQTPAEFSNTVRAEIERWGPVVKASGFVAVE
jgi:tripartite-type tricarboxylate transporter receptor subunit TctC